MKFMTVSVLPIDKMAEVAAASDKAWSSQPQERRPKNAYVLMASLPEVPPHSAISVYITEEDSAEAIAARVYPVQLAGATVSIIPVMEFTVAAAA